MVLDDSGGNAIAIDKDNNIYLTGYFSGTTDFDVGSGEAILTTSSCRNAFIAGYDGSGGYLWASVLGSPKSANGRAVSVLENGNFITIGVFDEKIDIDPLEGTR